MCLASTLVRADYKVKVALDSKLKREASWTRKMRKFGLTQSKAIIDSTVDTSNPLTKDSWPDVKRKVKKSLKENTKSKWSEKIAPLVKQGNLFKLIEMSEGDLSWKSFMFNLPKGLLSFATRAAIDVLPTGDNLNTWGKTDAVNCELCGNRSTLLHVLNGCKTALNQGRYTFRHNAIVSYIVKYLKDNVNQDFKVYADIQGCSTTGGTIPANIVATAEKPDIVCVNFSTKSVTILELSVPFESNINNARQYKSNKYGSLANDIESAGFTCNLVCFEVGSRGLITSNNKGQFKKIAKIAQSKRAKDLWAQASRIAVSCSYVIFNARYEKEWFDVNDTF